MKRVLVVNVNWLGDCVMTLPIFKAIKLYDSDIYLAVMVVNRMKGFFENCSFVDEVIYFDEKTTHNSVFAKLQFISFLKKKQFDAVFCLQRSFTRAVICSLAGIKTRVGFKRKGFKDFIFTSKISQPKTRLHRSRRYAYLFESYGITVEDQIPKYDVKERNIFNLDKNLGDAIRHEEKIIAVNPSANWFLKRWPGEYFKELIDCLVSQGFFVAVIGAKNDFETAQKVITSTERVSNVAGKTSLSELSYIIKKSLLFISADSGPAHLSAALGTNTVVLFGPTDPETTSPLGDNVYVIQNKVDCKIPCYDLTCLDNRCMKDIAVSYVLGKIKEILR